MAAKPLIGINTDYRATRKEHAALSFVAAGYYDGITASGGIPVILPPLADADDVVRLLDLALTGHKIIFVDDQLEILNFLPVEGAASMLEFETVFIRRIVRTRQ